MTIVTGAVISPEGVIQALGQYAAAPENVGRDGRVYVAQRVSQQYAAHTNNQSHELVIVAGPPGFGAALLSWLQDGYGVVDCTVTAAVEEPT